MRPFKLSVILIGLVASTAALGAETHRFLPQQFYTTFSGAHPPALRIKSGDRVITKTVDNAGVDWEGKTVTKGPNPQTGPFYVEGAEPGDTLVVTIERLEPNRMTALSTSIMAAYSVDPAALISRVDRNATRVPWTIDKAKGIVRLDLPEIRPAVIELPLRPMLGCLGVAPAHSEAISTQVPGQFGGNMDYPGLGAGAKVMLPVSEPGALLFLGDAHARQGEGEITGAGLETSMDVEFSVEVVKKKTIAWPRIETDAYIMVLGSSRSLLEAMQHGTTEMQRWLISDYGFSERGASIFMGQAAEYEIANIVDPNFTVVAKVRKSYVPRP
jgi:amidase